MVARLLQRKLYFSKDPEGIQHFSVGSSFFQGGGVQILFSIEPHITCDFPGGGGRGRTPYPPYVSALKHRGSNTDRNSILNMGTD